MIDQELMARVTRLPTKQRLELIKVLSRSLREELVAAEPAEILSPDLLPSHTTHEDRAAALRRLSGALAHSKDLLTDEALRDDYAEYLTRKHA